MAANRVPLLAQDRCYPRTAIGSPRSAMDLSDALLHLRLVPNPDRVRCGPPLVVSSARCHQHLTEAFYRKIVAHCLNPGIPLGDGSERMPAAFFRMSRCSVIRDSSRRRRSFSATRSSLLTGQLVCPLPPFIEVKHANPQFLGCLFGGPSAALPKAHRFLLERLVVAPGPAPSFFLLGHD